MKTKSCQSGSLYDLIVAADNLQAFVNIMYYLNKVSLSGMIPEGTNQSTFNVPKTKKHKDNDKSSKESVNVEKIQTENITQKIEQIENGDGLKDDIKIVNDEGELKENNHNGQTDVKIKDNLDENKDEIKSKKIKKPKNIDQVETENLSSIPLKDLNSLPQIKTKKPEDDGISFIEQMRQLDEMKQNKIASLMDKKANYNEMNEQDLMELRRDLQPVTFTKIKADQGPNLNPIDKQKNKIDEIRNLINLNKKKKVEEEINVKSEDKIKEEELEKRRNLINQMKTKLKSNFNHINADNENKPKED